MGKQEQAISIWFFIGALLAVYGVLILGAGLWEVVHPAATPAAMGHWHASIWWGLLLLGIGGFYCVRFRPRSGR